MEALQHSVSSEECIATLRREGFELIERNGASVRLVRGGRAVVIPNQRLLPTSTLDSILASADLSHGRFFELLCDEPTSTDVVFEGL